MMPLMRENPQMMFAGKRSGAIDAPCVPWSARQIVERVFLAVAACTLVGGWVIDTDPVVLMCGIATVALMLVIAEDATHFRVRDVYSFAIALSGLLVAWYTEMVAGAAAGALLGFAILSVAGFWFVRRHGTAGMGWGDYKLVAGIGVWAGPDLIGPIVLMAALSAIAFAGLRRLYGHPVWFSPNPYGVGNALPFGTFLGLAALLIAAATNARTVALW